MRHAVALQRRDAVATQRGRDGLGVVQAASTTELAALAAAKATVAREVRDYWSTPWWLALEYLPCAYGLGTP